MSRIRLTTRTAADMKSKPGTQVEDKGSGVDNDTAALNNPEHTKNDPALNEYEKGDPEAWAEGVNKDKVNKDDQKREETGHAPLIDKHAAEEAIASARKLEEKAVKAIIASQRMLPGATDEIISKQASILMHLPEDGLNATLANQENLAKMISKAAEDSSEEGKEGEEGEEDKGEKDTASNKEEDESSEVSSKEAKTDQNDPKAFYGTGPTAKGKKEAAIERLAALKKEAEALEKEIGEDKEAGKECKKEEEAEEAEASTNEATKKEDEEEVDASTKEASDASLLDQIFSGVVPPTVKKGASKLSGIVKKEASAGVPNDLSNLWSSAPDVSDVYN